mmetsp:Transcript_28607/g.45979  ORF Transcript_28607/g.45979 Transcript_28607/m.45979 type:complete len:193 (+) Transcript_28607:225-803(+)
MVTNAVIQEFLRRQERTELIVAALIVCICAPLSIVFFFHAHRHMIVPWSFPFNQLSSLQSADSSGGRRLPGAHEESEMISAHMVSAAHMCTGLSILGSALSTVSLVFRINVVLDASRGSLLSSICALLGGTLWAHILWTMTPPPPLLSLAPVFIFSALLIPLLIQWLLLSTIKETRSEIASLHNLKYPCKTA